MKFEAVHINELRLRVSRLGREEGRRLGEAVVRQLSANPPQTSLSRRISQLSIRMQSPGSASVERFANSVATKIRLSIREK